MFFFAANGVQLLDWPLYNPDFSSIENIWSILKENLYNRQAFSTKEELCKKIEGNLHVEYPKLSEDLYRR